MRRSSLLMLAALLASFTIAGTVLATHLPAKHNITTVLARGTLDGPVKFNVGDIKVQTKGAVEVVTADVMFEPLASAGWHVHPGPVFVVVESGTLSVWDERCVKHQYSRGDSFFEEGLVRSLLVKNESAVTPAHVYATFIVPVGTTALRIGSEHLCGIEE